MSKNRVAVRGAAFVSALAEADAVGHDATGTFCELGLTGGDEIVVGIELHPPTGDYGQLFVVDDDADHELPITGPVTMKYPDLGSLATGLSRSLYLADASIYQVHAWERNPAVSVVTMKRGHQAGGPIFLDHPISEVEAALGIIYDEAAAAGCVPFQGRWDTHARCPLASPCRAG